MSLTAASPLPDRLATALRGREDVRLALLFGSRARGTAHDRSDVDLAVWAPDTDLLELGRVLSCALGLEVDVVSLEDPDIPLLAAIVEHGVVVHEGRPGAHGAWRSRALSIPRSGRPLVCADARRLAPARRARGL